MKILIVIGTRPEAIKMCPVVKELQKYRNVETILCLSGQHKEMLSQVLDVFNIDADIDLAIMKENQTLAMVTTEVLRGIDSIIDEVKPNTIVVHGDTTTAYAAALAGFYRNIPICHVEAGLRTHNILSPFPEEFNRCSIDMISRLLFAPTEVAKNNLLQENIEPERVFVTGNTVIDAMSYTVDSNYYDDNLRWAEDSKLILLTAHRRENLGQPLKQMFRAIRRIVEDFSDVKVIYPVHLNPRVRMTANEILHGVERIRLIEPLDVMTFHNYIANSYLVLTDSGGIQEEAPSLNKPVLVMRDTTERPEGLEAGTLKLIGTSEEGIYKEVKELLLDDTCYRTMSESINPYGDGHAAERIVSEIINKLDRL